jgi:hypothetical protein
MRVLSKTLGLALVALFAVHAGEARAQQAASLNGTFTYAAESSDNVNAAINQAIGRMNFAMRPIARSRLGRTNQPYRTVSISQTGGQVSITTDNRAAIVTPASGSAIKWKREDGETLDVSTAVSGTRIEQVFKAEDGQRTNVYTLSPDGQTMTMQVTVTSGRLPEPLTYRLVYRRAS